MNETNKSKMLEHYYKERDKQLSYFWEHSKYLWGFVALCFTCYGYFFTEFLKQRPCDAENYVLFLVGVSFIGLIVSTLLLWMMKSCKAWYEVFETAIWKIESELKSPYSICNFWTIKDENAIFRFLKSSAYSQSKINLFIPYLLIIIWGVMMEIHACFLTNPYFSFWRFLWWALPIVYFLFVILRKLMIRSSTLDLKYRIIKSLEDHYSISKGLFNLAVGKISFYSKEICLYMRFENDKPTIDFKNKFNPEMGCNDQKVENLISTCLQKCQIHYKVKLTKASFFKIMMCNIKNFIFN